MRVVGIVAAFAPIKGRYPEIIRFIEPQGGNGPRRLVSGASSSGTPRERLQSRNRVRIIEGSCGYRGQYSGKSRFIEKRGVQDGGGGVAMLLNIVLPPASLPRSQTSWTGPRANCMHY